MTPNIARRRVCRSWQSLLRALFWTTAPTWIVPLLIAMAFPVIKGGEIMFKGGLMVFGACSCCDGGTFGVDCSGCSPTNQTPLTYSVTYTGVNHADTCALSCSSLNPGYLKWVSGGLGTYTLTQTASPCVWQYDGSGPVVNYWASSACVGAPDVVVDQLQVTFNRTTSDLSASSITGLSSPFATAFPWFRDTNVSAGCCGALTAGTNIITAGCGHAGNSGSAVLTASC